MFSDGETSGNRSENVSHDTCFTLPKVVSFN